jgi:hypothetical protein
MPETVETAVPWTIKGVTAANREVVVTAARQEGITVGQWLDNRIAEWLASRPIEEAGRS